MGPATKATDRLPGAKLPAWRLALALAILGGMIAVLAALAPFYIDNFRLQRAIRQIAREPDAAKATDIALQTRVIDEAQRLHLPVEPDDVQVIRQGSTLHIQTKYAVLVDFRLYQVDLHFR